MDSINLIHIAMANQLRSQRKETVGRKEFEIEIKLVYGRRSTEDNLVLR